MTKQRMRKLARMAARNGAIQPPPNAPAIDTLRRLRAEFRVAEKLNAAVNEAALKAVQARTSESPRP